MRTRMILSVAAVLAVGALFEQPACTRHLGGGLRSGKEIERRDTLEVVEVAVDEATYLDREAELARALRD